MVPFHFANISESVVSSALASLSAATMEGVLSALSRSSTHADTPQSRSATPGGEETDLTQHASPLDRSDPARRQLAILRLHLSPNKESPQLLGCHCRSSRAAEWVEEEIPLPT